MKKRVVQTIEIGERYSVKEYEDKSRPEGDPFRHYWQPCIDGKDFSSCYPTLRSALVGLICLEMEGLNTRADKYICKMLGMPEADIWK